MNKTLRSSKSKHHTVLHEKCHAKQDVTGADRREVQRLVQVKRTLYSKNCKVFSMARVRSGGTEVKRKGEGKIRDEARTVAIHLFTYSLC